MKHPTRWHKEAEGPYVHMDDVIEFFNEMATAVEDRLGAEGEAIAKIMREMGRVWADRKAEDTRTRLLAVVNRVDPGSIREDLLALRDELAEEEP